MRQPRLLIALGSKRKSGFLDFLQAPRRPGNLLARRGVAGPSAQGGPIAIAQRGDPASDGEVLVLGCIHGDECAASGIQPLHLPWPAGTAPNWQNHRFPGTASFVVELPRGPLADTARWHLGRSIVRLARHAGEDGDVPGKR